MKQSIIAGAGVLHQLEQPSGSALEALEQFRNLYPDWAFGHFSFEDADAGLLFGIGIHHRDR